MQNGQSGLHEKGLDSSSELWNPVYFENGSQPTTNAGLNRPLGLEESKGRLSE